VTEQLTILIAVHHFPPTFKGGAEWRAHRTAKWLQNHGHTVKIICVDAVDDPQTDQLRYEDTMFDELPVRRLFLNINHSPDSTRWEYDNPWVGEHVNHYLTAIEPDLVHLISGYLMTSATIRAIKQHNLPLVATLTDFWFLCPRHTLQRTTGEVCPENNSLDCVRCGMELQRRFRLPAQKLPKTTSMLWQMTQSLPLVATKTAQIDQRVQTLHDALSLIDIAICPSNFLLEMYQQKGFEAKRMMFMRQGLRHVPTEPPKKILANKLRVGYIGGIAPHKGVQILVEAFLKLSPTQAELKLYGDTSKFQTFYETLLEKIQEKSHIQFKGTFNNQQIGQIHAELDVLVVPSTWYENSPNVILEAFAYQTPVITSDLGGMAELVTDKQTGLLFNPNDADDLANKLQSIINNPTCLSDWQQNIQPVKVLETEMAEIFELYQSVL